MIPRIALLIGLGLLLVAGIATAQNSQDEKAAVASAEKWLTVVDKGKYANSWQEAAVFFKNAITEEQWEQSMLSFRKPLGRLVSRKVESTVYKTSLPGAQDGAYVIITIKTAFENKKSAIETVTPMLEKDGKWRVSGYFIK
ncbi:MAG: DUF4019 domain-containing protein [Geobacter sp.]|nr:MAG: DUF4019 domain-containing protein [Geobacter sp.]